MRNTVWGFGDSYMTTIDDPKPIEANWSEIVANDLDMNIQNVAISGSSLEYSAYTYTEALPNIKSGDVILFAITSVTTRKWIVKDELRMQSPVQVNRMAEQGKITDQDRDFYLRVIAEINPMIQESLLKLLLQSLHSLIPKGVKVIVLPCFHHVAGLLKDYSDLFPLLPEIEGNLQEDISFLEIKGTDKDKQYMQIYETRRNHMTYENHAVLAEKVLAVIKEKTSKIDLKQGFHANVLEPNRPC